jgi:hypothetical protein
MDIDALLASLDRRTHTVDEFILGFGSGQVARREDDHGFVICDAG